LIRPIFNAENLAAARDKLSEAVATLEGTLPKVAGVLEAAEEDIADGADRGLAARSSPPRSFRSARTQERDDCDRARADARSSSSPRVISAPP
jgi:hypothetical protein